MDIIMKFLILILLILPVSPNGKTIVAMSLGGYAPCDAWGGNYALYDVESQTLLYNDYFCQIRLIPFHFY